MTETVVRIRTVETQRIVLRAPQEVDFDVFAAFRASDRSRALGGPYTRADAFQQMAALIGRWNASPEIAA